MDKVRVALVGCGVIADVMHLPGIKTMREMGKVELVAVCDMFEEKAKDAAAKWDVATWYSDLDVMLAKAEFDLLVNTTQVPQHYDVSLAGLRAGRHVYTQKPMATTVEQATTLIEEAKAHRVLLGTAPEHTIRPVVQKAKELVESGAIGKVAFAKVKASHDGTERHPTDVPRDCTWFYQPPVTPILDIGVHGLTQITAILGPIKRVAGMSGRNVPVRVHTVGAFKGKEIPVNIDDIQLALLDFGDDCFGFLDSTFCVLASRGPRTEIYGSEGVISLDGLGRPGDLYLYDGSADEWTQPDVPPTPEVRDLGVLHMVDCLRENRPLQLRGERGRHLLEVMLQVPRAAKEGRTIEMNTTF